VNGRKAIPAIVVGCGIVAAGLLAWGLTNLAATGRISGYLPFYDDSVASGMKVAACEVVDASTIGQCTWLSADQMDSTYHQFFTFTGLQRGKSYALKVTAPGYWTTWSTSDPYEGYVQAGPALGDIGQLHIATVTVPGWNREVTADAPEPQKMVGVSGTISPHGPQAGNLSVQACEIYKTSAFSCTSEGVSVDQATGDYVVWLSPTGAVEKFGSVTVFAEADGYLRTWLGGKGTLDPGYDMLSDSPGTIISPGNTQAMTGQDITLAPAAQVTGKVSLGDATNAGVRVCQLVKSSTRGWQMGAGCEEATVADGVFTAAVIPQSTVVAYAYGDGKPSAFVGGCVSMQLFPSPCFSDTGPGPRVTVMNAPDGAGTFTTANVALPQNTVITGTIKGKANPAGVDVRVCGVLVDNSKGTVSLVRNDCFADWLDLSKQTTFTFGGPSIDPRSQCPQPLEPKGEYLYCPGDITPSGSISSLQPDADYVAFVLDDASPSGIATFAGGCTAKWFELPTLQCLKSTGGLIHTPVGGGSVTGVHITLKT